LTRPCPTGTRPGPADGARLAEAMSTYWTNFARAGDPNASGLTEWSAFDATEEPAMEFGDEVRLVHHVRQEKLDLPEELLPKKRSASAR